MKLHLPALLVGSLFYAAGAASAAGLVDVSFIDSDRFTDAGSSPAEKDANLKRLQSFLQELGNRHLGTAEVLKIEVLDLDIAGILKPWLRSGPEVRIIKGAADWPRISLRYTLEVDGKAVRSASEQITDMNYTRGLTNLRGPQPLQYEKNMLDMWFKDSFVQVPAAS